MRRSLWQASYTVNDDDTVTLAPAEEWERVRREYQPVEAQAPGDGQRRSFVGGHARALGDGKIGGYLVAFNGPENPDLYGTYFTPDTYYGPRNGDGADFFIHHSIPLRAGLEELADHRLQPLRTSKEQVGIWVEAVLDMADEYERAIYELVQQGKLSWSSASAPHVVRIADDGKVLQWPIVEGSLTPFPGGFGTRATARSVDPAHVAPEGEEITLMSRRNNQTAPAEEEQHEPQSAPAGTNEQSEQQQEEPVQSQKQAPAPTRSAPSQQPAPQPAQPAQPAHPAVDPEALRGIIADAVQPFQDTITGMQQEIEALRSAPAIQRDARVIPGDTANDQQPDHMRAFEGYIRTGRATRALQESTEAAGGALVPAQFSNEIVRSMTDASILRTAGARVLTVSGTDSFSVPQQVDSPAATLIREGKPVSESNATMKNHTFHPYKFTKLTKASEEVLADSRVPVLTSVIQPDVVRAYASAENAYFATGTGNSEPQGLIAGGERGVKAAATADIASDEIVKLYFSLNYLYRPNATWLMNDSTAEYVRTLKDGTGRYLWADAREGSPPSLMGRPVVTLNTMAEIAADAKVIAFGDLSYFWIADFGQMDMKRLDELYAETYEIGFRWYKRFDSRVVLSEAIKYLEMQ
jgi:HK97 family phage major capsid protein